MTGSGQETRIEGFTSRTRRVRCAPGRNGTGTERRDMETGMSWMSARKRTWACVLATCIGGGAMAQSVTFKPKYEAGQKTYIEKTSELKQSMKGGPMGEMAFKIKSVVGMLMSVESADANGAKLTFTYDRVASDSDAPMMSGSFDSDRRNPDESPELAEIFGPMLGGTMTAEVDKDGRAKSFTGTEAIVKKMEESAGGNMMFEQIKSGMTDAENRRELIESTLNMFPDKPVNVGESWTKDVKTENANLGPMTIKYECKLDKIEKVNGVDAAHVSYKYELERSEPKANPMGGTIRIEGGGGTGTLLVGVKSGQLLSQKSSGKMSLKFEMSQGDQKMEMDIGNDVEETLITMSGAERAKIKDENKKKSEAAAKSEGAAKEAKKDPE